MGWSGDTHLPSLLKSCWYTGCFVPSSASENLANGRQIISSLCVHLWPGIILFVPHKRSARIN